MARESAQPRLSELAERQWGVVTRAQLVELGLGDSGLRDWVRSGRLRRLYRGVYAVGHNRLRLEGRWLAAVFACGPGAVLSHLDAAALWELRQSQSVLIDVTVPSRNGRAKRPGIRIHRSSRLRPEEVTVRHSIPVTTVARTLLDLADVLQRQALKRVITEAEYLKRFDLNAINAVVQNNPGRRGARLVACVGAGERTRSELEDRFLELVERHGLARPMAGVWIEGYEADFLWPEARLIVELDGLAAHGTRSALRRDRRRDRVLWRAGYRTMRLTDDALDDEDAVLDDLAHAGVRAASCSRVSSNPPSRSSSSPASAR